MFSGTHGESKYVVMCGGLHTQMAIWKTLGDSGWTSALTQAGIASSSTSDSFPRCFHVTRTRHAHQVSALALSKLLEDTFLLTDGPHDEDTKQVWKKEMVERVLHFNT